MTDRKEYIECDSIIKAVVIQQEKERKDWMEYLQQLRGTKDYSSREIAVDNWLRGYNESVQYLAAKIEEMNATDVVEVVRCGECDFWDSNHISCEDRAKCLTGEGGIRYRGRMDFCSYGKRKNGADNG